MYWDSKSASRLPLVSSGAYEWRVGGDCFGKMEEVIKELNNMCNVGDIISSMAWVV